MSQQLLTQLEQVCRRRKRRRWLAASCWALTALLVVGFVLVGLDRVLGIADLAGRVVLTLTLAAAGAGIFRNWNREVAAISATPLQIAQEVEQRYPSLRGELASAWEFAAQADDDPTAGSESLRRAVVLRATSSAEQVDWDALVPRRPLKRGATAFACVVVATIAIGWCLPHAMATGWTRLINPLSRAEWPRNHNLQFIDPPELIAAGDDLLLQLTDTTGKLPEDVVMHYRTRRQGRWQKETRPVTTSENPQEIRWPNVRQSVQFRAVGGDHKTMPWHSLEVVSPPRIDKLQITVHPPEYTNLPAREWRPNSTVIAGSALELSGRTDLKIERAELRAEESKEIVAQVSADGRDFRIDRSSWQVQRSDTYRLQFNTTRGLTTRAKREIVMQVVTDQPPTVRFSEPQDELTVLPTASVPLVIEAQDKLALSEIDLVSRRSDQSETGERRLSLWRASDQSENPQSLRTKRIEHQLDLEPWSVTPGTLIELHAQAKDAQPMTGQSVRAVRLNVVSEAQLWAQLLEQQSRLAESIAQLLSEQRELLSITGEWSEFPSWSRSRWTSSSNSALFRQRQVATTLGTGQYSVASQLEELLSSIQRNRLLRPEATDRLQAVAGLIDELVAGPLTEVEAALSEFTRQTRRSIRREKLATLIGEVSEHQRLAVLELRRAIELLTPGNVLGRLERELDELQRDQKGVMELCQSEIAPQLTQTDEPKQLEEDLRNVLRRQRGLAGRLAELLLNMSQASERLADNEPSAAARLTATVELARELELQSTIQSAADHLMRRRLGNSTMAQRTTLEHLAQLRARLVGHDEDRAAQRLQQLQATERQLRRLRRETSALENQLQKLTADERRRELERLRRQREQLAQEAEDVTRQLERLRIPKAAKPAREASEQLRRAQLDRETIDQARKKLDEAQRTLTAERRRQQVALARLQMAQLEAKLKALVGFQESIVQEIRRLDGLRERAGQLTAPQQQSVTLVADRQIDLRDEIVAQAERLESLPVFAYLLQQAGRTMQQVGDRLQRSDLGPRTQSDAAQVVVQLKQILESLKQEQQDLDDSKQEGEGSGGQQPADTPQAQTLQLAVGQLKLLKTLQTALQQQTVAMEAALARGEQPAESASELARQQQELTQLAEQLVPEPPDPPAEETFPSLEDELEKSFGEAFDESFPQE